MTNVNDIGDSPVERRYSMDLQQIVSELGAQRKDLATLHSKVDRQENTVVELSTKLDNISKSLDQISKHLLYGNGTHSVLTRVALLEKNLDGLVTQISTSDESLKKLFIVDKQGGWQTKAALVTGVLSLIGVLISAILQIVR